MSLILLIEGLKFITPSLLAGVYNPVLATDYVGDMTNVFPSQILYLDFMIFIISDLCLCQIGKAACMSYSF